MILLMLALSREIVERIGEDLGLRRSSHVQILRQLELNLRRFAPRTSNHEHRFEVSSNVDIRQFHRSTGARVRLRGWIFGDRHLNPASSSAVIFSIWSSHAKWRLTRRRAFLPISVLRSSSNNKL